MKFINNDTIALIFLGLVALMGVYFQTDTVTATALGAIGGYIGSKAISE